MATFKDIEEARAFFKGDLFATGNGMVIDELGEDWCICSMDIRPDHRNATGGIMGGVIFTLGDFAFAVASNQIHRLTVGQQMSINFLNGTKGNKLFAQAICKKNGRSLSIFNIYITDDLGKDIAQLITTGFKIN